MSRNHVAAFLALFVLVLPASTAFAQRFTRPVGAAPTIGRAGQIADDDAAMCNALPGGSRIRPNCDEVTTARLRAEAAGKSFSPLPRIAPQCQASTEIAYTPRKAVAHLDGIINVKSCPAGSTGAYTIVLSVKNEDGETTLEFTENWKPSDRREVKFASDYPIGEGAELVDVRLRNLTCTCPAAAPPAPPDPEAASSPDTE